MSYMTSCMTSYMTSYTISYVTSCMTSYMTSWRVIKISYRKRRRFLASDMYDKRMFSHSVTQAIAIICNLWTTKKRWWFLGSYSRWRIRWRESFHVFTYSYRNTAFSQSKLTFSKYYVIQQNTSLTGPKPPPPGTLSGSLPKSYNPIWTTAVWDQRKSRSLT